MGDVENRLEKGVKEAIFIENGKEVKKKEIISFNSVAQKLTSDSDDDTGEPKSVKRQKIVE